MLADFRYRFVIFNILKNVFTLNILLLLYTLILDPGIPFKLPIVTRGIFRIIFRAFSAMPAMTAFFGVNSGKYYCAPRQFRINKREKCFI